MSDILCWAIRVTYSNGPNWISRRVFCPLEAIGGVEALRRPVAQAGRSERIYFSPVLAVRSVKER